MKSNHLETRQKDQTKKEKEQNHQGIKARD